MEVIPCYIRGPCGLSIRRRLKRSGMRNLLELGECQRLGAPKAQLWRKPALIRGPQRIEVLHRGIRFPEWAAEYLRIPKASEDVNLLAEQNQFE